jgi:glycosyltransferase involved in cell wall biosynthesis
MNLSEIKKVFRSDGTQNHTFSLLIPSWNNLEYLKLCIRSIRQNSGHRHQIILLINEGKDGSLAWVELQEDIDYVYAPENPGICYGLNACRSLVHTDYMLYITSRYFVKYFLKRGEKFSGTLSEPVIPFQDKILHKFKLLLLLFQNS